MKKILTVAILEGAEFDVEETMDSPLLIENDG